FFTAKFPLRAGQPQQAQLDTLFLFRIGLGERLAGGWDQPALSEREEEGQRQEAERLEADPGVGRDITPNTLVQYRHGDEEKGPAKCKLAPAFLSQIEHGT